MCHSKSAFAAVMLAAGLGAAGAVLADTSLYSPYTASYDLERKGIGSAHASFSLAKGGDGAYVYKSVLHPSGLAALFLGDVTQTSTFKLVDDRPQSDSYQYSEKGKNADDETIQFDWNKKIATSRENGKQRKSPLTPDSVDVQLVQLLLANDVASGKVADHYQIVDHGEATTYDAKTRADKQLHTQAGDFDTKVVVLTNTAKKRTITAWLAPKLHYLPVQIQQVDRNTITLTLEHIAFNGEMQAAANGR